ncbi:MAG TPA: CPBP family glutamic-type intramembrane protease [Candidatus Dormibacteraeota bacterium]
MSTCLDPAARPLPVPALAAGAGLQAGLSYFGFRYPRAFWALMTVGLSGCGIPGILRLRRRSQGTSPGWLGGGLLAGLLGYAVTRLGAAVAGHLAGGRRSLARLNQCVAVVDRPLAALLVVPAAVGEEIFWRESVLGARLEGGSRPLNSLLGVTLAYAAVQAASLEPLPPLGGLLLGAGTGWLRLRSGSIWPGVVAHVAYSELCLVRPGLPSGEPPRLDGQAQQTT